MLKLEIPNLTKKMVTKMESLDCVKSVAQENASHIKIHATGDKAFDAIIDAIRAENAKINSIEKLQPTLEDVFLHITGREVRDRADKKIALPHGPRGFRQKRRIR